MKLHFVKKARKDNPVVRKGESYWWWKPRIGGRGGAVRYSKEKPKPSQVTQSSFLSSVYAIQEDMQEARPESVEDLQDMRDDWQSQVEEIAEEERSKFENMPEGLQQGDTGQLLEERAEAMERWAEEIGRVEIDPDEDLTDEQLAEYMEQQLGALIGLDPGV